jgi:regulator of sigma E protease
MSVVFSILVFLLVLSLVIILHELGHFWAAKRAGILCYEFNLGMGPVLWKKRIGETLWQVRAIPIGGSVAMAGEEIDEDFIKIGEDVGLVFEGEVIRKIILKPKPDQSYKVVSVETLDLKGVDQSPLTLNDFQVARDAYLVMGEKEQQIAPHDRNFNSKTLWQRFLAIVAGPMMNFILAYIVFVILTMITGVPLINQTTIGSLNEGYPAETVLSIGDQITEINGISVETWGDVTEALHPFDESIDITFVKNTEEMTETIHPIFVFYTMGFRSNASVDSLTVGPLNEDGQAFVAGMREGDTILEMNGTVVASWIDIIDQAYLNDQESPEPVTFTISRNDETFEVTINEPYNHDLIESQGLSVVSQLIGIGPEYQTQFFASFTEGWKQMIGSVASIFVTLGLLFGNSQVSVGDLAGPVGIYSITASALQAGFVSLLAWIGFLSVNLGVVNLLPIPALDGGRLVFLGIESVTKKKINPKVENMIHFAMFVALMMLFLYVTINDIGRLF